MRERIKAVATELLITKGVRGLRFADIADRLAITRANVHYHFGTKTNLVDAVIDDYVETTLEQVAAIWGDPALSFRAKVEGMMAFNRQRYDRYNPPGRAGRCWSLITRMRLESDQVSERARATLARFTGSIETLVAAAVAEALASGELVADAPAGDIGVQLIAIVDSAGSITQDSGSFDRLARLYTAFLHIVYHAYGRRSAALAAGG
jgi:AcrR family transcriptional regulator